MRNVSSRLVSLVRVVLVESIPVGVEFNSSTAHPSIFQAWMSLMSEARSSVDIASFYWTLTNRDTGTQEPSAVQVRGSKHLAVGENTEENVIRVG